MAKREKIQWLQERGLIGCYQPIDDSKDMLISLPKYWSAKTRQRIMHSITPGVYHAPYERATFYRKDIINPPTEEELKNLFVPAKQLS